MESNLFRNVVLYKIIGSQKILGMAKQLRQLFRSFPTSTMITGKPGQNQDLLNVE